MSLLTEASLVITPNAVEEGKLFSIIPTDGSGDLTVTRATTATRVNSAGLIEVVPRNLVRYSEQFDNATWTKYQSTITTNVINSPIGTLTADKIIPSAVSDLHYLRVASAPINLISGVSIATYSIYAKQGEYYNFRLGTSATAGIGATFNLSNGTISNNTAISAFIEDVGNGWYRCIVRGLVGSVLDCLILNNSGVDSFAGNAVNGLYFWGAQIEGVSTATEYFPTTDRLDVPRLDYTNSSCPSILVEPQRTNLLLRSEEFENASWTKTNSTVTANQAIAPDGALTADKYIPIDTGESSIRHNLTFVSSVYTPSIYVKLGDFASGGLRFFLAGTVGANATLNIQTGEVITSGATFVAGGSDFVGNGWYRVYATINNTFVGTSSIRFSLTDTSGNLVPGNGTDGIYIWGAQLEAGSNATSYIPTVASTVTRNADVISKTGIADLIGQTEGTIFVDLYSPFDGTSKEISLSDGTLSNRISIGFLNQVNRFTIQVIKNNITQVSNTFVSVNQNIRNKIVLSYEQNNYKLYINGVLSYSDTLAETFTNELLNLQLNRGISQNQYFGEINSVALWKTALTDQECINLTTI